MSINTSKYQPLFERLRSNRQQAVTFTFGEIESLLSDSLPPSARIVPGWWSNRRHGSPQAAAWIDAGYRVERLNLDRQIVTFRRPKIRCKGKYPDWTGDSIRALRLQLGLTQSQLANELGVRQQTISEWENEAYTPSRALLRSLQRVAEQYGIGEVEKREQEPGS